MRQICNEKDTRSKQGEMSMVSPLVEEPIGNITDYRACFDASMLRVWHLNGKDRTWEIAKVARVTLTTQKGEVSKKPLLYFKGIPLPFVVNKTNGTTIEQLYGRDPHKWIGKMVTLYPTQTQVGRNQVDCIRIRNKVRNGAQVDDTELGEVPDGAVEEQAKAFEDAQ